MTSMSAKKDMSLGFLLSDITRLFRKHFDRRAIVFGLTRAQWRALKWLEEGEGMYQSELAEQLEMEPIAIGRVIDRLESAGFVRRRPDPSDRRRWRLFLTPQVRAVLHDMEKVARELRGDAFRGISKTELQRTAAILRRMKQNLLDLDDRGGKAGGK